MNIRNLGTVIITVLIFGAIGFTIYKLMYKSKGTTAAIDIIEQKSTEKSNVQKDSIEGKIQLITNKKEFEELLKNNPYAVAKLSATWCPP